MTDNKPMTSKRKILRWVLAIGAGLALLFLILVAIVVAPDQFRTPAAPRPFLPEPVRAALDSASRAHEKQDAETSTPAPAPGPQAERLGHGAVPDEIRDALTTDTRVTEFIQRLLPVQDLSALAPEHRDAARKWNDAVAQSLGDLVAVLAESSLTSDSFAVNNRLNSIQTNLLTYSQNARKDLGADFPKGANQADFYRHLDFFGQVAGQVYADHEEYMAAGFTTYLYAMIGKAVQSEDPEGRRDEAVYYFHKAGWKGRAALAAMQILSAANHAVSAGHARTTSQSSASEGAKSHE